MILSRRIDEKKRKFALYRNIDIFVCAIEVQTRMSVLRNH